MRHLVVFYSRTGNTARVARLLAKKLSCDCEEIIDNKTRRGSVGLIGACLTPLTKGETTIKEMRTNPGDYDVVIIGTPIWWYTQTPATRAYIAHYRDQIKMAAFFFTCQVDNKILALSEMEDQLGKMPIATLRIDRVAVKEIENSKKVEAFLKAVRMGKPVQIGG